ncbi:hypothetical protein [Streptomyces sp. HSG2]|uniref:hypothetical protein n=1 Tax=Streptomyces sp. HSG2 TaxID=2797167 RepID=UPI001903A06E|nr:hypothetical protein [Streptomyces sp. HSG2]
MTGGTIGIDGDRLRMAGGVSVRFVRTPRAARVGARPPALGAFPVRRVEDYPDTVPESWRTRGGVMLPVHLGEAMWLSFVGSTEPAALQVGVGGVCAVSGGAWNERLRPRPRNYLVLPGRLRLDGVHSAAGAVRPFTTVSGGLDDGHEDGEEGQSASIRLLAYPPRDDGRRSHRESRRDGPAPETRPRATRRGAGGTLAVGGVGRLHRGPAAVRGTSRSWGRRASPDRGGPAVWAERAAARVLVRLVPPGEWRRITGEAPPPSPVDRASPLAPLPFEDEGEVDPSARLSTSPDRPLGDGRGRRFPARRGSGERCRRHH